MKRRPKRDPELAIVRQLEAIIRVAQKYGIRWVRVGEIQISRDGIGEPKDRIGFDAGGYVDTMDDEARRRK